MFLRSYPLVFTLYNSRDFEANVTDNRNPQTGLFTKLKLALFRMIATFPKKVIGSTQIMIVQFSLA